MLIDNHVQNNTGYWGAPDSAHQFCEPHYAFTDYAAEAFNSLSSTVYVVAAVMAYFRVLNSNKDAKLI